MSETRAVDPGGGLVPAGIRITSRAVGRQAAFELTFTRLGPALGVTVRHRDCLVCRFQTARDREHVLKAVCHVLDGARAEWEKNGCDWQPSTWRVTLVARLLNRWTTFTDWDGQSGA